MPEFDVAKGIVYDDAARREYHRITAMYSVDRPAAIATEFETDYSESGDPIASHLRFDRLAHCYLAAEHQFPRVFERHDLDVETFVMNVPHMGQLRAARLWVLGLPHGSIVVAVTVEISCAATDCIAVLEALHHKRFTIGAREPWAAVCSLVSNETRQLLSDGVFGVDVHQILFVAENCRDTVLDRATGAPRTEEVANLVYRYRGEYRNSLSSNSRIYYPPEANRGLNTLAATGPYVAVIAGQQGYIENAFFVSAAQMLGAAALLRRIRIEVYDELLRLRRLTGTPDRDPRRERIQLAVMSERLGKLELELSFGVEAHERVGSLLPSLRVIDYHHAVFSAADMPAEAATIGHMLERLGRIIQAELEGVRAQERVSDERRRLVGSVVLGLLSIVALPLGMIFGYFGINTTDVRAETSLFDVSQYVFIYSLVGAILAVELLAAAIIVYLFRRGDARTSSYRSDVAKLTSIDLRRS